MEKPKILYVYRTRRQPILQNWKKGKNPDSMLFGYNHLHKRGYQVNFFDLAYTWLYPLHLAVYPLEQSIINQIGMGFKLDQAISLLPLINRYDIIILTGDSCGLPFLWLKHLRLINKPIIYLSSALAGALQANKKSWVFKFYKKIFPSVDILTCYANIEKEFFLSEIGLPKEKVKYIPYCTDWKFWSKPSKQKRSIIAAAGVDTSRDYATFFKAIQTLNVKVEIACRPQNISGLSIPKNTTVSFHNYLSMRKMFQKAAVAVVPLKDLKSRGGGHMVALESASCGCPLIASKIKGMTTAFDFTEHKHLLWTKPNNAKDLREKILYLLNHPQQAEKIGTQASQFVKKNYTTWHLAQNIAQFIEQLI